MPPGCRADEVRLLARVAGGRLDRAARLLDEAARARRAALLDAARAAYRDEEFDPTAAAAGRPRRGERAAATRRVSASERSLEGLDLPTREAEQRVRRAGFGAERGELLAALDDLGGWYRDLVVVAGGAESAVVNADRLDELTEDAPAAGAAAEDAAEAVRETWRIAEEFNVSASLALEALFVRLRRTFSRAVPAER